MENIYLGRQCIIDENEQVSAYEILYKDDNQESNIGSKRHASASVINSILNKFGTRSVLGDRRAFIKVDQKFLLSDLIFSLPSEFFIFSILECVEMNERVLERIKQLHEKKYQVGVDDIYLDVATFKKYELIYQELSYFKIKMDKAIGDELKEIIKKIKSFNIKIVGTRIDTHEQFALAKELSCDWFEGYFFAKPKIIKNVNFAPQQANILKLYNLLINDTNIDEITTEFEENHEVSLQLLQCINSGSFDFKEKISSIHHVITSVGRAPLAQWLMLMIYSKSVSKVPQKSALMLMVKNRTELMEKILKVVDPTAKSNALGEAYFVGVLSLSETLFGRSLEHVLEDMNISKTVEEALLNHKGILGDIYRLVQHIEQFNTKAIVEFEQRYNLEESTIQTIALESMQEVQEFENPQLED